MKELYSLKPQKRQRLILLLALFFGMILLTELIENRYLQRIDDDFSSMYEDRLIPASQMYELSELLHEKQLIFELLNEKDFRISKTDLNKITSENFEIESILEKYETTFLVSEEEQALVNLKNNLQSHLEVEAEILHHLQNKDHGIAQLLINSKGREFYSKASADLHRLAQIQPEIGKELLAHYRASFGNSSTLYYFKVALTVVIGILVLRLLGLSNLVSQPRQRFELN